MASRQLDLGSFGEIVRNNIATRRAELGLTAHQVAESTASAKKPIGRSAISEIERGARRVDVDDLVALSVALDCSPTDLLTPGAPGQVIELGGMELLTAHIRAWLMNGGDLDSATISGEGPADELARIEGELEGLGETTRKRAMFISGLFAKIDKTSGDDDPDLPLFQAAARREVDENALDNARRGVLEARKKELLEYMLSRGNHGND